MNKRIFTLICMTLMLIAPRHAQSQSGGCYDYDCENMDPPPGEPDESSPDDPEMQDDDQDDDHQPMDHDPMKPGDPINPATANLQREVMDMQTFGDAPIKFSRHYNSRTTNFGDAYNELGNKQTWQHNWNYEVRQLQTKTNGFFDIKVRYPNGQEYNYQAADTTGVVLVPQANVSDRLYKWSGSKVGYTLTTPKGLEMDFPRTLSPKFQLTQFRDNQGAKLTLAYEQTGQLKQITNNYGRWIAIDHETGSNGVVRVKGLRSSDGRQANYTYSAWASQGTTVLTGVSNPDGSLAAYSYIGAEDASSGAGRPLLATANDPTMLPHVGATIAMTYNYNAKFDYGSGPYLVTGTALAQSNLRSGGSMVTLPGGGGAHPEVVEGDGSQIDRRYTNGLATSRVDGAGRATSYSRGGNGYGFIASKTRANGAITNYMRNAVGQITQRTNPLGGIYKKAYDTSGFITYKTDENNNNVVITRGLSATGNHNPTRVDYADGTYETGTYNLNGQVLTRRDRNGGVREFTYNNGNQLGGSLGDMMSSKDAMGNTTSYTYNSAGLRASITTPGGETSTLAYNRRGQVTTITHSDLTVHTFEYDQYGNMTKDIDELGHAATKTYNDYNRVTMLTDATGRTTQYEYGLAPDAGINGAFRGVVNRIIKASGNKIELSYDASERLTQRVIGAGTAAATTTTYTYDSVGRPSSMINGIGQAVSRPTDSLGRASSYVDALNRTTTYAHDSVGNLKGVTFPDNRQIALKYDSMNRATAVTDANSNTTAYNFAIGGDQKKASLTDPRNYSYNSSADLSGKQTALSYPDDTQESASDNANGQVATRTTRGGSVQTTTYDSRNRETSSSWNDGVTPSTQTGYDAVGNVTTLDNGVSHISYTYDESNRVTTETESVVGNPAGPQTISYSYDGDGQRSGAQYSDGTSLSYGYDQASRVISVAADSQNTASLTYDAAGRRSSLALADGTNTVYAYDQNGNVSNITINGNQGNVVGSFAYNRDIRGNVSSVVREDGSGDYFRYDGSNQLTTVGYDASDATAGTPATAQVSVAYRYDASGNWSNLTATSAAGLTVSHGLASAPSNDYVSDLIASSGSSSQTLPMSSDANNNSSVMYAPAGLSVNTGFMPGPSPSRSLGISYDSENRPSSLVATSSSAPQALRATHANSISSTLTMQYDTVGRCVSRTLDGSTTYLQYDGWNLVHEYDGSSGAEIASYVHTPDSDELLRADTTAGILYHHHDALGSVTHLTNSIGQLVEHYQYDAFGSPRKVSDGAGSTLTGSAMGNRFLFAGREQLPLGELYDVRHRVYSPSVGRFAQVDPIRFKAGDNNMRRYVGNNPVNAVDPSGLDTILLNNSNAAGGSGHNAYATGDPTHGYDYRSYGPNPTSSFPALAPGVLDQKHFDTKEQMLDYANKTAGINRYTDNPTTDYDTEQAANKVIDDAWKKSDYNVLGHNCTQMTQTAFDQLGLPYEPGPVSGVPNNFFNQNATDWQNNHPVNKK